MKRVSTKALLVSLAAFAVLLGLIVLGGYVLLAVQGPEGRMAHLLTTGKLLLHRYSLVEKLTANETERLYLSNCTGECHGRDVVEKKPRTPLEWEWIVSRKGAEDRADLSKPQAGAIVKYLQRYYSSKVPTTLPDEIMRFTKKHLWRMEFSEERISFDIIYMPPLYRNLMPYFGFREAPTAGEGSLFVVYINAHSGEIPRWDLSIMATIKDDRGREFKAKSWDVLYVDGQKHHIQGILTFPEIEQGDNTRPATMEMLIRPRGGRERAFQWRLPIPNLELTSKTTKEEVKP